MSYKLYRRKGSDIWQVRFSVRGRRIRETTGTADRQQAELYGSTREARVYEASIFGERAAVSYARAALSYLEDGETEKSIATEFLVNRLVDYFGPSVLLAVVAGDNAQSLLDEAVKAIVGIDAAPATKNRGVITPHNAILRHASRRGWCARPDFQRPEQPKGKTHWLTPREFLALHAGASPHLKPLLTMFVCAGPRVSEATGHQWPDTDLLAAKVVLRDTKNGSDRPAYLPDAMVMTLANMPADADGVRRGHVFRRDDGEPYADKEKLEGGQIKTAFRTACRRAGLIAWERDDGVNAERTIEEAGGVVVTPVRWRPTLTPHDLRHTWATWFYALTKDPLLLQHEGGWKKAAMVERYTHLMPSHLIPDIALVWGASHPLIGKLPTRDEPAAAQIRHTAS